MSSTEQFAEVIAGEPLFARTVSRHAGTDARASRPLEQWRVGTVHGELVALVPGGRGGEIQTRDGSWELTVQRERFSWSVLAQSLAGPSQSAVVKPGWLPNGYAIRIGMRSRRKPVLMQLKRSMFSGAWILREGRVRLAAITEERSLDYRIVFRHRPRSRAVSIPFLAALALHIILLDRRVPTAGAGVMIDFG